MPRGCFRGLCNTGNGNPEVDDVNEVPSDEPEAPTEPGAPENESEGGHTSPAANYGSDIQQLTSSVEKMLSQRVPKISDDHSIFRVPTDLRELNDKAYTPKLISIGPLHWGKPELKAMEMLKLKYLKAFLRRTKMTTESCLTLIWGLDKAVRRCYGEIILLSRDEFAKMVLLDSAFIIESLIKHHFDQKEQVIFHYVRLDLILVENQLPFFVLESIFNLAFTNNPLNRARVMFPSLVELSVKFLRTALLISDVPDVSGGIISSYSGSGIKHFVDLLRTIHVPSSLRSTPRTNQRYARVQTATALQVAGMKFKRGGPSTSFLDMTFTNGVLEIPHFRLNGCTETLLRNMIALERRLYRKNSYIVDCVLFMDGLINSAGDIGILVNNGVMGNHLSEAQFSANIFNRLTTKDMYWINIYYFQDMSQDMNSYCKNPWNKVTAYLNPGLLSSPARVAASGALLLTIIILNKKDSTTYSDVVYNFFLCIVSILLGSQW